MHDKRVQWAFSCAQAGGSEDLGLKLIMSGTALICSDCIQTGPLLEECETVRALLSKSSVELRAT
jgi:hypothetical protein